MRALVAAAHRTPRRHRAPSQTRSTPNSSSEYVRQSQPNGAPVSNVLQAVRERVQHVEAVHAERGDHREAVEHREGDDGEPAAAQSAPPLVDELPISETSSSPRTMGSVYGMAEGGSTIFAPPSPPPRAPLAASVLHSSSPFPPPRRARTPRR